MRKVLLAAVAVITLTAPATAAVITTLGVNPNSATGSFNNSVGGAAFSDEYTFQLVGSPQFITFSSATNVFTGPADFITGFTGQLFEVVGAVGGGDDIPVSGAVAATSCPTSPVGCQILAGSAVLGAGSYFLQIAGIGGGTAGYGGNLTTHGIGEVPIPGMALAVPFGALGFAWLSRRRRKVAA